MSRARDLSLSALLAALALLAAVAAAELSLAWVDWRAARPASVERSIRLRELEPGVDAQVAPRRQDLDLSDSLDARPRRLRTDAAGFIEPSRPHEHPDLTVVFLGGSTTECRFVDEGERFPALAGRLLEERTGLAVNALNGGVAGNHALHSLDILVNKVIPLAPDAVVVMHGINDLSVLLHEGSYWNANPTRSLIETRVRLRERSAPRALLPHLAARLTRLGGVSRGGDGGEVDEFARSRGVRKQRDPEALRAEFERALRSIVAICKVRGIAPVLMTEASRFTEAPDPAVARNVAAWHLEENWGFGYAEFRRIFLSFNDTVRKVARDSGATLVDLAAGVPPERTYLYDHVHLNEAGSRLAARAVSDALLGLPAVQSRKKR